MLEGTEESGLIERAIRGDADALTALLENIGPEVRRQLTARIPAQWRSLLSDDDVMQQTYADAFRSIRQFTPLGDGAFRAWLASLADCNLRDAIKMLEAEKRGGGWRKIDAIQGNDSYVNLFELLSSSGTSPTRQAARGEIEDRMRLAVDTLPEAYKAVVRMVDLEGQSAAIVAGIIGRSPGAVHMLRQRAHDRLKETLGAADRFFTDSP